jgi:ATP-dependent DNA helicase Rep
MHLGVRIMRQDGHVLGLKPQFSILDADDVVSILKDCGGTTDANTARQWQWAISAWKNAGLTGAQAELALLKMKTSGWPRASWVATKND